MKAGFLFAASVAGFALAVAISAPRRPSAAEAAVAPSIFVESESGALPPALGAVAAPAIKSAAYAWNDSGTDNWFQSEALFGLGGALLVTALGFAGAGLVARQRRSGKGLSAFLPSSSAPEAGIRRSSPACGRNRAGRRPAVFPAGRPGR
jgi:hypothetical protein